MYVYLANIALIYIWALLLLVIKPNDNKKIAYCTIVCGQWVLISGLRHITVGSDTGGYANNFEWVKHLSWSAVFERIRLYIIDFGSDSNNIKDPGYTLLQKVFQIFFDDYQIFLLFIALLFTVTMAIWIYQNSEMPCLSFIIYSTLFYSFFSITGHRQTIATALVVFIGYNMIKNKKLVPFLILCFFAFFIHKSIVLYAPFYFIAHKKITWRYVAIFSSISIALLLLGRRVYGIIINLVAYDYYDEFNMIPKAYILFISFVSIAVFLIYNKEKEKRPDDYQILYNATMLTFVLTLLCFREQGFMRVQQYYALYLMILIPEIIKRFDKKIQFIPYVGFSAVLIARLIDSPAVYKFFWQ